MGKEKGTGPPVPLGIGNMEELGMRRKLLRGLGTACGVVGTALLVLGLQAAEYPKTGTGTGSTWTPPGSRSTAAQPRPGAQPYPTQARTTGTQPRPSTPAARPTGQAAYPATRPAAAATPAPAAAAPAAATPQPAQEEPAAESNAPSPQQALKLAPIQADVDYARPTDDEVARCKVTARRFDGGVGWVVEDAGGLPLRRFVDTNGDNKVDQWSYFKDGIEVYRDIDSDFNGKVDQYRWLGTAGSRWAIDKDEDGQIDSWQVLSVEEATAEIVAALAKQDAARFARVVVAADEVKTLGLGPAKAQELTEKLASVAIKFKDLAAHPKGISEKTRWVHFSGQQPGIVPAGADGATKDLVVYENVVAIVQTGSETSQVQIGTLVKIGDVWRAIDAPQPLVEGQNEQAAAGFFFQTQPKRAATPEAAPEKSQETLAAIQKLDAAAAQATSPDEQAKYNAQRADLIEKLAGEATKADDRSSWLRQLADMLGATAQSGAYPDAAKRLAALAEKLSSDSDRNLAAHVRFAAMTAEYTAAMQAKGADFAKVQADWLKKLEQFVSDYPKSPETAEAMLQLGLAQEFAGQDEAAKKWYAQVTAGFGDTLAGKKAAGAVGRLDSVGKTIDLQGKGLGGTEVDISKLRGRVVVIQCWSTWCEPCKVDMATLKELCVKYGKDFTVIGVNLDNDEQAAARFLRENPLPWQQIVEAGGLDSRPAQEIGVLTLPMMILVDKQGRVANRNVTTADLDSEVKKLIK